MVIVALALATGEINYHVVALAWVMLVTTTIATRESDLALVALSHIIVVMVT